MQYKAKESVFYARLFYYLYPSMDGNKAYFR